MLSSMGFRQLRVRDHGGSARIEVDRTEMHRLLAPQTRTAVVEAFKKKGFFHISIDLEGYRTGSLNAGLERKAGSDS